MILNNGLLLWATVYIMAEVMRVAKHIQCMLARPTVSSVEPQ